MQLQWIQETLQRKRNEEKRSKSWKKFILMRSHKSCVPVYSTGSGRLGQRILIARQYAQCSEVWMKKMEFTLWFSVYMLIKRLNSPITGIRSKPRLNLSPPASASEFYSPRIAPNTSMKNQEEVTSMLICYSTLQVPPMHFTILIGWC